MPKRITVIMPDDIHERVLTEADKEKRKKSAMCAVLIERGLPDTESTQSYQQRIADEMLKKKEG